MHNILENTILCCYQKATSSIPIYTNFSEVVDLIRNNQYLKLKTQEIQNIYKKEGKGWLYNFTKTNGLPLIIVSSIGSGRRIMDITDQTPFLFADFDGIGDLGLKKFFEKILQNPHVALAYRSASKRGLHVLFHCEKPDFKTINDMVYWHKEITFPKFKSYCLNNYHRKIDWPGKNIVSPAFLSHDPNVYVNFNAVPLRISDTIIKYQKNNILEIKTID